MLTGVTNPASGQPQPSGGKSSFSFGSGGSVQTVRAKAECDDRFALGVGCLHGREVGFGGGIASGADQFEFDDGGVAFELHRFDRGIRIEPGCREAGQRVAGENPLPQVDRAAQQRGVRFLRWWWFGRGRVRLPWGPGPWGC